MNRKPTPITDPPSAEEMNARLEKVRSLMERESIDVYVAAHPDNIYYLTNFAFIQLERPIIMVIPLEGKPRMVLPTLEAGYAVDRVLIDVDFETYYEYPAPDGQRYSDALKKVVSDSAEVGIESSMLLAYKQATPGNHKIVDIIDEARLVKSEYEIGRIAYASQVVNEGLAKALELSKPGAQEITIYSEGVRHMMTKVLLEIPNPDLMVSKFVCAVWPPRQSVQPHSQPGVFDALEEGGPNVSIITAQANGYSAELERTYFIGNVPEEAKAPFNDVMEARALAFELAKPGVPAAEVDRAVLDLLKKRGHADHILHRTGHGFGVTGHEPPWIAVGSDEIMEENMVISIEPGVYIPGIGGFRHSDTVLITAAGCLPMTQAPENLEDLILPI